MSNPSPSKICRVCRVCKAFPDFRVDKKTPDGYRNTCKACTRLYKREWTAKNPDRVKASNAKTYAKHAETHRERSREWYAKNTDKAREYNRSYVEENKEAVKARRCAWYEANRQHVIEKSARWADENRDQIRPAQRIRAHRRRTQIANAGGSFTQEDIQILFKRQRGKCACCRESIKDGYEIDHIEPVSKGGSSDPTNLQLLCMPCNRRKSARNPIEFMQSRGFLL
jgi:5-methylcytosine-specific restriction endonuclease McrA